MAAKLRILTTPGDTPPMEQYYIEHGRAEGGATPCSSLAPSNRSMRADMTNGEYPPNTGVEISAGDSTSLYKSTFEYTGMTCGTPRSNTDSEETLPNFKSFELIQEWNKKKGCGFDSLNWAATNGKPCEKVKV